MSELTTPRKPAIAVIIPAYRVSGQILDLIARIGPEVASIVVVDDACPEKSGDRVVAYCQDPRVKVVFHSQNQGVGGAVLTGYQEAMRAGADILVKLDGDGQMNPTLIPLFIGPISAGRADYTKGNRFYRLESLASMPPLRILGNAALSLMAKLSTGYYSLFDPTNGYTAIHANVLRALPLNKIARRYFFETDLLFRISTVRAVVVDVPMDSRYADETSSLNILRTIPEFFARHGVNLFKRIFYGYFLRDFNPASIQLVLGILLSAAGFCFGLLKWHESTVTGTPASSGTVMLAALPFFLGIQFLLSFLNYDFQNVPRQPVHGDLRRRSLTDEPAAETQTQSELSPQSV